MAIPVPLRSDVAVLGAGIVGICVALHLQNRSRSVVPIPRDLFPLAERLDTEPWMSVRFFDTHRRKRENC